MRLSELCQINPSLKLVRDAEFDLLGMVTTNYTSQKVLSFIEAEKYLAGLVQNKNVVAIICTEKFATEVELPKHLGIVVTDMPREAFYLTHNELAKENFYWERFENKVHPTAQVHPSAVLYDHSIEIGENTLIEANVVIHPGTIIGNHCIVRSGTQLGTNGFQFLRNGDEMISVHSGGRVIIEDYVEIQHLTCVDRGVFGGDTIIKRYAKIDNQCQIAHDAYVGERSLIVSGTQFGGRVTLGEDSWCGINSTISNGIRMGDRARASLGAVVTKDVPADETVSGNFAIKHQTLLEQVKESAKKGNDL